MASAKMQFVLNAQRTFEDKNNSNYNNNNNTFDL